MFVGRFEKRSPLGRCRRGWGNNIKTDIKK
jgi:hypothetical protein